MKFSRIARIVSNSLGMFHMAVALGCTALPELTAETCGNYVIDVDQGEDCDTHATMPNVCARPGEEHACHYICGMSGQVCPSGYGCSYTGVCRRHSGAFEAKGDVEGYAWPVALHSGDFDSDGRGDLMVLGAPDAAGYRSARALFSQDFSLQPGLGVLPPKIADPAIGTSDLSSTPNEIAFADFEGVALLRGYGDRTADFAVFPSVELLPKSHARMALIDALPTLPDKEMTHAGDEIVALITAENGATILAGIDVRHPPVQLAPYVPGGDVLAGEHGIDVAKFDELSSCLQVILAYHDASAVDLYTPCMNQSGTVTWNVDGAFTTITMVPSAKIDKGIIPTDIDRDGHLDLVIGAGGITYLAYGLGDGQFTTQKVNGLSNKAAPFPLTLIAGQTEGFPLAIAELNGDGVTDFVLENGIVVSNGPTYEFAYRNLRAPWSEALVGNLNANDWPDVVAVTAGALDIDFFNNAGNGVFGVATLPTEGVPRHLNMGDFDGDLLNDIVLSESILEHGELSDHLSFSFGEAFGPPAAPIATGEVGELGQLVTGNIATQLGTDPMMEVGAVVEGEGNLADSISLLPGRASRAIYSTLPLRAQTASYIPVSLTFGRFGDSTSDLVALATNVKNGRLSLFRIEAFEEEGLTVPTGSDHLPDIFGPSDVINSISPRHGAIVLAIDLDQDGTDEALVASLHVDRMQGAFAAAKYDTASGTFKVVEAVALPGQVSVDSTMFAADVDGDGLDDLVLTTGTHDAPLPMIVRWGDGLGRVPLQNASLNCKELVELKATAAIALRSPSGKGNMLLVSTLSGTHLVEFSPDRYCTFRDISEIKSARAFAAIDFDRDGVEDIAAQTEEGLELFRSIPK